MTNRTGGGERSIHVESSVSAAATRREVRDDGLDVRSVRAAGDSAAAQAEQAAEYARVAFAFGLVGAACERQLLRNATATFIILNANSSFSF